MGRRRPAFLAGVRRARLSGLALVLATAPGPGGRTHAAGPGPAPPAIGLFFEAASLDGRRAEAALGTIAAAWRDGYAGMVIDLARFFPSQGRAPGQAPGQAPDAGTGAGGDDPLASRPGFPGGGTAPPRPGPAALVRARLVRFLEKQTGEGFGDDLRRWRRWLWSRPLEPHPDYAAFKAALYAQVDPRMAEFFRPGSPALVRLDEVDWGGVKVNGIPPLDHPATESVAEAAWLKDDHVVFGLAVAGEARAYPKRILAWHELVRDRLGGVELALVYCTLCGTAIPYGAEVAGVRRTFGTSGLLYRSNKLMFDEESNSLWSTTVGRPVVGPLAGQDLELTAYPVVTTSWGEWRRTHPGTTVVSIRTGHARDYCEGVAYRDYFASDRTMFEVPGTDTRLKAKDEVLALLLSPRDHPGAGRQALAISRRFLEKNRLHALRFAGRDLLVVTSPGGASRVYASAGRRFARERVSGELVDGEGRHWQADEDAIRPVDPEAGLTPLPRVPARIAYWFGWYAQFPESELVR
jgi:hypothetical protein